MDLIKLLDRYNIFARIAPAFLFGYCTYLVFGINLVFLNNANSFILVPLAVFVLYPISMFSTFTSKKIEDFFWKKYGNPLVRHLKKSNPTLYQELSLEKNDDEIVKLLLKTTRPDEKVFWKNVSYGFFRNALPLSFVFAIISFFTPYFYYACIWLAINFFSILLATSYFANQVIDSYLEIQATPTK